METRAHERVDPVECCWTALMIDSIHVLHVVSVVVVVVAAVAASVVSLLLLLLLQTTFAVATHCLLLPIAAAF